MAGRASGGRASGGRGRGRGRGRGGGTARSSSPSSPPNGGRSRGGRGRARTGEGRGRGRGTGTRRNSAIVEVEEEPKIKWKKSKAKELLLKDILEGRVPKEAKDSSGKSTMKLEDIYLSRPEFSEYKYSMFSSRLSSLRKTVKETEHRAVLDQAAFDNYIKNHEPALFTRYGYAQWQGSEAQKMLQLDIKNKVHESMSKKELHESREVYFENYPLNVFRDYFWQEIRTAKYLHTIKVKGKDPRKKK